MKGIRRARDLTRGEKDFVYDLLESNVLSSQASARVSRDQMGRQFENAKETLEQMKHNLGEEYVDMMKERLESLWEMRAKLMVPTRSSQGIVRYHCLGRQPMDSNSLQKLRQRRGNP